MLSSNNGLYCDLSAMLQFNKDIAIFKNRQRRLCSLRQKNTIKLELDWFQTSKDSCLKDRDAALRFWLKGWPVNVPFQVSIMQPGYAM